MKKTSGNHKLKKNNKNKHKIKQKNSKRITLFKKYRNITSNTLQAHLYILI